MDFFFYLVLLTWLGGKFDIFKTHTLQNGRNLTFLSLILLWNIKFAEWNWCLLFTFSPCLFTERGWLPHTLRVFFVFVLFFCFFCFVLFCFLFFFLLFVCLFDFSAPLNAYAIKWLKLIVGPSFGPILANKIIGVGRVGWHISGVGVVDIQKKILGYMLETCCVCVCVIITISFIISKHNKNPSKSHIPTIFG